MKKTIFSLFISILFPTLAAQAQVNPNFGSLPDLKVEGKEFVDPSGHPVTLHGVMDTPNDYFNGARWRRDLSWPVYNDSRAPQYCREYFTKVFDAITKKGGQGSTYCNLFRLHLDPAWTNDPNKQATAGGGENDISRFSADRLRTYMTSLYMPIAEDAIGHGLYVIIRPPGVFPEDVTVGDAYNEYLKTVWDIVSSNDFVKAHAGQIMLELGNEPVRMSGKLADYFQPIVNKIRQNGFTGILLLPGLSYQADYRNYNTKGISDSNFGYAVHNYPGWYGGWDASQTEAQFISTFEAQVPIDKKPIVITEVDWSPMKQGAGHWNEEHTQYTEGNFGTWGTGTTNGAPNVAYKNTQNTGWGLRFRHLVDKHPNISFTLQGTTTYVDMDAYLKNGTIKPAFEDAMKTAGYTDARQACSGYCFDWFYDFACGDRVPCGTSAAKPDAIGNASIINDERYTFYTTYYASFVFHNYGGTKLDDVAEFFITLGENSTTGYRLDIQLKDASGNIIKDGENDFIIGTEAMGTRNSDPKEASKVYDMKAIFSQYLGQGCTIGDIRLNTAIPEDDNTGKYFFTISEMGMTKGNVDARSGSMGTSLADIKMYRYSALPTYVYNDNCESDKNFGGWGSTATIALENGVGKDNSKGYKIVSTGSTNSWDAQFNIENLGIYTDGVEYTLEMDIKGTVDGSITAAFQNPDGYKGCGNFPAFNVTTDWQTIKVKCTVSGDGASRLLLSYGNYIGTLYFDNIKVYSGSESKTEITGKNINLNTDLEQGKEAFGAGLLGNVTWNEFADLSEYKKMIIKGTGGTLRVLYNRPQTGSTPELNPSLASGSAEIDLTANYPFHLNSIKVNWGQTANISKITLIKDNGSGEDFADYYITGAGTHTAAVAEALADEEATVIDLTGYTGRLDYAFASANPNCILIYKDGNNVGSAYDVRNLVKEDKSAWRITLTDGYNFRAPFAINTVAKSFDTASPFGASYSRELSTEWATIALPFDLDVTYAGSPEIYQLTAVDAEKMVFTKAESGTIAAGSIILYHNADLGETKLYGNNIAQTVEGFNIQPLAGVEGWFTAQSFTSKTVEDVTKDPVLKDYEVYGVQADKFVHATKKINLKPFRAFFLVKKGTNTQVPKASYLIATDEEATGISSTPEVQAPAAYYDISGRRINSMKSGGITIIRKADGSVRKVVK